MEVNKRKLVLVQNEPREQFDIKFENLFGLTFTEWIKTAKCYSDNEIIEFDDDKIFAGITAYDSGFKVYA
jgi:hypothetical protein